MIRAAIFFLLLVAVAPAFGQSAPAQPTMRPSIGVTQSQPTETETPAPAPAAPTPPTALFSPIPQPPSADQCRTACAQAYYFCLAENEISDCAPAWGQCRLRCGTAATTTPAP